MKPHPGQERILASRARYRVVACGRRFGKTELGKLALLCRFLAGGRCWWLAPTLQMADQVWRDLKRALAPLPEARVSEAAQRIDLPGGAWLAIRSTHHADHLRGAGLDFAVLDEAAFIEEGVWPEVVRPMLLERRGTALFLSSPNGRNWFWQLLQLARDAEQRQWQAFHFTSRDNPLVDSAELEAIRRTTPARVFREEYLAEFLQDSGQVFDGLRAAARAPAGAQPQAGRRYVAGVDWGRAHDYTAIVILDCEMRAVAALERFRQVGWTRQRGRLQALHARWNLARILAESNSMGEPNIEALQEAGLPVTGFQTTAPAKRALIEALALAIESGQLALLPDEALLNELANYRLQRRPDGSYRYGAPPGLHDDLVMALALAWRASQHSGTALAFA